jgi:hypothetical protein
MNRTGFTVMRNVFVRLIAILKFYSLSLCTVERIYSYEMLEFKGANFKGCKGCYRFFTNDLSIVLKVEGREVDKRILPYKIVIRSRHSKVNHLLITKVVNKYRLFYVSSIFGKQEEMKVDPRVLRMIWNTTVQATSGH